MAQTSRGNISMAERLSATMKIMAQCKRASPDLEKGGLRRQAQTIEEETYNNATSADNYQSRIEEAISTLSPAPDPPDPIVPTTADTPASPSSLPVERIGPYAATYHASGVFSTIYRSHSLTSPTQTIAVKLTTPSTAQAPHNPRREARLLRLAVHPSVVPLLTTHSIAGGHFLLTFPFLPYDLGSLLDRPGALSPSQARSHLYALFAALEHCHAQGILHRDVKPSNLLLASPSGPAYLADFGIAWKESDPDSEPAGEKITDVGTTCYRAPELLFGWSGYGEGMDMWAAGCVVAEVERGGQSLFDAGDLGSELALINSVFRTLGTPDERSWPETRRFPDWGRLRFTEHPAKEWKEILPRASEQGRDLTSRLVTYECSQRTSAAKVLMHPYFEFEYKNAH